MAQDFEKKLVKMCESRCFFLLIEPIFYNFLLHPEVICRYCSKETSPMAEQNLGFFSAYTSRKSEKCLQDKSVRNMLHITRALTTNTCWAHAECTKLHHFLWVHWMTEFSCKLLSWFPWFSAIGGIFLQKNLLLTCYRVIVLQGSSSIPC